MALSVMLADDEPLIADALQVLIQEIDPEIEIAEKIYDGQKAWAYIQEHQPDAAFLDIRMPKMDGFEVLEKITQHQYDTKVVILSAFRDFEYAQKAIRLGAIDYLAKPIEQESLFNALQKLKRLHSRDMDMQQSPTMHAVSNLLRGGEEARTQFALWKFFDDLPNEKIQIGIVRFETPQEYTYYREYRKLSPDWKRCIRPLWYNAHYWIIVYKYAVLHQAPGFNVIRKSFVGRSVTVGFSEIMDATQFPLAFQQAMDAVQHVFYEPEQQVFLSREIKPFGSRRRTAFGAEPVGGKLLEKVQLNLKEEVHELLGMYFNAARKNLTHPAIICEDMIDLFVHLHSHTKYLSSDKEAIVTGTIQWLRELRAQEFYNTVATMKQRVQSTLDAFLSSASQNAELTDRRRIVRKVQQYCEHHYQEEITLEMVVKEVHITKSWFCSVFKKETGQSFGSYLTELRMKKAQELLVTTELKINQVAVDVGYKNASHFNHTFAEKFGMTPLEYRRQNWGRTNG